MLRNTPTEVVPVSPGRFARLCLIMAVLAVAVSCSRPPGDQAVEPTKPADAAPPAATAKVREPAVAGQFYPGGKDELRKVVEGYLAAAKPEAIKGRLVAIVCPHAGYNFSGPIAAYSYKLVAGRSYDDVVVIGPSHHTAFAGAALTEADLWRTPLGDVPIDQGINDALLKAAPKTFTRDDTVQALEHSAEVEIPFLQVSLKSFRLVPVCIQDFSPANCKAVGHALAQVLKGRHALIVASSDMAHYPATDLCAQVDKTTLASVVKMDLDAMYNWEREGCAKYADRQVVCTLCGLGPVVAVMVAARDLGADRASLLKYANSGQLDKRTADQSVGYGAVAISNTRAQEPAVGGEAKMDDAPLGSTDNLTVEQKRTLLTLARRAILEDVSHGLRLKPPTDDKAFEERRAVFVTLKAGGKLRGCIGTLEPQASLGEAVIDAAISAATEDPRFPQVRTAEVAGLDLHISVLSPMVPTTADKIVLGKHGIVVSQGMRRGVFLPEVAPEQGWDLDTTLTYLCVEKAGLPADAWKHGAQLESFTTQSFGDEDVK